MDNCFPIQRPAPVRNVARLAPSAARRPEPRQARGLRGLQLTGRGRAVVAGLALMIAAPAIGLSGQAFADTPSRPLPVETVTVTEGDALWAFARQVALPGEDLRQVVEHLQLINQMDGVALIPGQRILLPIVP